MHYHLSDTQAAANTALLKQLAKQAGFDYVGIAKAEPLQEEAKRLEQWLQSGMHGEMAYMERYFDLRIDPRKLVPGALSVVSLLINYYPPRQQKIGVPKVARYAYGLDYHKVFRKKLKQLFATLKAQIGHIEGRVFVDSAPVMDKAWAAKSGLGWLGKNSNLINKSGGSYFFVGEIISNLKLIADGPIKDYCGTCTRCIDACPTEAIVSPYVVDGSKCISYYTIELKNEIPQSAKGQWKDWIFGCDICQEVCPWNRFSVPTPHREFHADDAMLERSREAWEEITEEVFNKVFERSPLKRAGYKGLRRNVQFVFRTSTC